MHISDCVRATQVSQDSLLVIVIRNKCRGELMQQIDYGTLLLNWVIFTFVKIHFASSLLDLDNVFIEHLLSVGIEYILKQ